MDKKTLESYRGYRSRIEKVRLDIYDLEHEPHQHMYGGKVKMSSADFPYTECSSTIECDDDMQVSIIKNQIDAKKKEIAELEKLIKSVDEFINNIPDPTARSVFEYYYTDGLEKITQKELEDKVGISRKKISEIINKNIAA